LTASFVNALKSHMIFKKRLTGGAGAATPPPSGAARGASARSTLDSYLPLSWTNFARCAPIESLLAPSEAYSPNSIQLLHIAQQVHIARSTTPPQTGTPFRVSRPSPAGA
jgi:hypothetical protein